MLIAESIIHTLNPYVIDLGGWGPRWYGVAYVTGFLVGWALLNWMAKTKRILLSPQQVSDFVFIGIIGVIAGGRIGHVLLYDPHLLWTFTRSFPWWGLLDIMHGGMSSHGGILGVTIAAWVFARRVKVPFLHMIDVAAIAAPAGLSLGRLANWVNGELLGRPLPEAWWSNPPWWSLKFPADVLEKGFVHAAELSALRRPGIVDPAAPFPDSIVLACYQGKREAIEALAPLLIPRWPSQFFQAITDGPILMAVLVMVWWRPRRPGVVAGWFIATYGAMRLMTEQFRTPDKDVVMVGPLTLPMFISVMMIMAGTALSLWSSSRRHANRIGGFAARRVA